MIPNDQGLSILSRRPNGGAATILIVSAVALSFFLFRAGEMPLTDPDEGRYAEISREMAIGGDWVVPRLFGIPYLEKPPLLYWLTGIAFCTFGPSEIAARLAPALAGAFGVLFAGLFARRHLSSMAGTMTAIVLASTALYAALARTVLTDMPFAIALSGALFALYDYREAATKPLAAALSFWLFLAAATLSKGPVAIVLCGLVIAADAAFGAHLSRQDSSADDRSGRDGDVRSSQCLGRSWRTLFAPTLLLSAPLFLALALPWFGIVQRRYPGFLSFYLWKEHLQRAAGAEHAEPLYWFVPWLLGGLLPWTPFAIAAAPAWRIALEERSAEGRVVRFLLVWAVTVFVVFSLARGKLATYILPMFPPLAVLIGNFLDRVANARVSSRSSALAFGAAGLVLLVGGVAAIVGATIVSTGLGAAALTLLLAPVLAGGVATILWRGTRSRKPLAALLFGTLSLYVGLATAAPGLCRSFTARPLIAVVGHQLAAGDNYALWGAYLPSAAFYLDRPPLLVGTRPELRFGTSVAGSLTIVRDLGELKARMTGGRLYVFTDNRAKRERELRETFGDVHLVARNYVAAVWLRP
jgi:4-amino-4-deoxy-L-arabinose transferase-like glycosyltransferase